MRQYMRIQKNGDDYDMIITRREIDEIQAVINSGKVLELKNIPIEGMRFLFVVGTPPNEAQEGNLRSFVIQEENKTVDIQQVREFMEGLGNVLGYKGAVDVGEYRDLTAEQIEDAALGRGEFPLRGGGSPESEP